MLLSVFDLGRAKLGTLLPVRTFSRTLRWGPILTSRWRDMDPFKLNDENEQYNINKMKSCAMSIAFLLLSSSYFLFF